MLHLLRASPVLCLFLQTPPTTTQALIDSTSAPDALAGESAVRAVAVFDHEEVGSDSAQGAGGPVMRDTITRVSRGLSQVSGCCCTPHTGDANWEPNQPCAIPSSSAQATHP
jgi:aspartyl aminopeptidase